MFFHLSTFFPENYNILHSAHDGQDVSFFTCIHALCEVYALSTIFAFLLTIVAFIWCGHVRPSRNANTFITRVLTTRLRLSLHDLAKHNRIEHDGSLGHADAQPGEEFAPVVPDEHRLNELLGTASTSVDVSRHAYSDVPNTNMTEKIDNTGTGLVPALTFTDFCLVRLQRDRALHRPFNKAHNVIALGEVSLALLTFGLPYASSTSDLSDIPLSDADSDPKNKNADTNSITRSLLVRTDWYREWSKNERLPDEWVRPRMKLGLRRTSGLTRRVKNEVMALERCI